MLKRTLLYLVAATLVLSFGTACSAKDAGSPTATTAASTTASTRAASSGGTTPTTGGKPVTVCSSSASMPGVPATSTCDTVAGSEGQVSALVALVDIPAGTKIAGYAEADRLMGPGTVAPSARPADAIVQTDELIGKTTTKAIPKGTPIGMSQFR